MTDTPAPPDLAELSAKASPGEWHCGCFADPQASCQCKSILTDQMMGAVGSVYVRDDSEPHADEYPSVDEARANLQFIVALVNAFRAGTIGAPARGGWDAAIEAAAKVARTGCLVPPDGGSPTDAEREMCEEIERRIRALRASPPSEGVAAQQAARAPGSGLREACEALVREWRKEAARVRMIPARTTSQVTSLFREAKRITSCADALATILKEHGHG